MHDWLMEYLHSCKPRINTCTKEDTYFENVIWWWHLGCKDGWNPLSAAMLGWFGNIISIQNINLKVYELNQR